MKNKLKTTWRVLDEKGKIVFVGLNGFYGEADKYIKEHKEVKLELDPEMNEDK